MMINAEDIKNVTFKKSSFGGYKPFEVDSFIDNMQVCYEKLQKENTYLKDKIDELSEKLNKYQEEEGCIRNAILSAQKIADSSLMDADNKSKGILLEASRKADEIINKAKAEAEKQRELAWNMHMESEKFRSKLIRIYENEIASVRKSLDVDYDLHEENSKVNEQQFDFSENVYQEDTNDDTSLSIEFNKREYDDVIDMPKISTNFEKKDSYQEDILDLKSRIADDIGKSIEKKLDVENNLFAESDIDAEKSKDLKENVDVESGNLERNKRKDKLKNLKFGAKYRIVGHDFGKGLYSGLFRRKK